MSDALPHRLKRETGALHAEVERAGVMAVLLTGRVERATYVALLANLQAMYAALETGLLRHAAHAVLAPLHDPALFRADALAADLATLHGPDWREAVPLVPAGAAYVRRLQELAETAPALLAAHAYVRYLGDLHGGQILASNGSLHARLLDLVG